VKNCERCNWHLYVEDKDCMLNPGAASYCRIHDYVFFEEKVYEFDDLDEEEEDDEEC